MTRTRLASIASRGTVTAPAAFFIAAAALLLVAPIAAAQNTEAAEVDTVALAALSPEELFLRSSSAALQFAPMIQPSRRILVREHERTLPYLVTQLDTDGPRERHALEDILVRIGEPAVEPLIEAFEDELRRTDTLRGARMAAGILGRLEDDRATAPLNRAARHDDWKVRSSVASALGRVGSPEGLTGLLWLLRDENEIVRKSSAVAIRRMATVPEPPAAEAPDDAGEGGTPALDPVEVERYERRLAANEAVKENGIIEALAEALDDPFYHVRYSSAAALAEVGTEAIPTLTRVAFHGRGPGRIVALSAIGRIGDRDSLGPLTELLGDGDWAVRAHAALAIGEISADRRARKALSALLAAETHPFVIVCAGNALAPMQ